MNDYKYITEYLPKRYNANAQQQHDRELCYAFKDGNLPTEVKSSLINKIDEITSGSKNGWVVCFIPASTSEKTRRRFSQLSAAIANHGYATSKDAIYNAYDKEAEHISGKTNNPIESFGFHGENVRGKKVVLIDDIITRGTTFNQVADKLKALGAMNVTGLFYAKTVNPDYVAYGNSCDDFDDDYEDDGCDYDDYDDYYEEKTYCNYNGSYAQDVEGWSDQDIDDVFDGDPDAYWNID